VPQIGEEDRHSPNHISRSLLTGIIKPRMEEVFELVRDRIRESGFERLASRRVVLTGGASQLTGVRELAARILEKNVRSARPLGLVGVADAAGGPAFSTCAGLLSYMVSAPTEAVFVKQQAKISKKDDKSQLAKIGRWLKINF
jgi:cell division protein FtsA